MRAVAEHARSLDEDGYRAARAALADGDPDERHFALFLAVVRRDVDAVAAALEDPRLRRRALAAAIRLPVPDAALARIALSDIRGVRRDAYRVLRLSRRRELAARLLPEVRERYGDAEAAQLLPACPPSTVGEWLPRLDAPAGVLSSLARTAPRAVAEHLVRAAAQAEGATLARYRFVQRHVNLAESVARRDPGAALILAEKAPRVMTGEAVVAALRRPRDLLAAVRRAGLTHLPLADGPLPRSVRRALRGLAPEELAALAAVCRIQDDEHRDLTEPVTADPLLALVPSDARLRLVRERVPHGNRHRVPVSAVAALDPEDRAEFVRDLRVGPGRGRDNRLRLGVLLPPAEAESLYRGLADDFDFHQRSSAWPGLLAAAAQHGDPAGYARVFTMCERAWHDMYVVRQAALEQAANAPARLLAAVPYAALRDAARTTVQSHDSTPYTLRAAERLLRRAAVAAATRHDHERAAAVALLLAQIVADTRFPGHGTPLDVDRSAARAIWAAGHQSGGTRNALGIAALLERHIAALPGCDDFLARTALESDDPAVAARAAGVWLADPATREARAAELLRSGKRFSAVPRLEETVTRRRTDLLESLPAAAAVPPWLPRTPWTAEGRWLPPQRALIAQHLERVAADDDLPLRQRTRAASQLRDATVLGRLAEGEVPQPVAAAALASLGRMADRAALAPLLEYAGTGGVRGRAAMAALRRLLDGIPDAEAVEWLGGIARDPRAPVGSRKEAARALGERPGEQAFGALLAAWDVPGQHHDVLAVLAVPLSAALERPGIAARLRSRMGHAAVRQAVIGGRRDAVPAAEAHTHFLAALVREGGDPDVVEAACGALNTVVREHRADEVVAGALAAALCDPARLPDERYNAGYALSGAAARSGTAAAALRDALGALAGGRAELRLLDRLAANRHHPRTAVVDGVYADALERAGLGRAAARAAFDAAIAALREGDTGPDRWDRCLRLVERHPYALSLDDRRPMTLGADDGSTLRAVLEVARALGERPGTPAGLAAVLLVRSGGEATGWTGPWRDQLDALKAHADPDVAQAALVAELRRPAG
ncbi:hypothetical protein [Streptomyces sp. MI02-7b]|uniref:hypothetical protein n=1 Tax=Streptomyces sp. MI02-7b TaxID=462941 RepID=UPI0029B62007|nr:hypothetical protein [Streptomyces sp. MI02-7b]MDX3071476.1 hypothetical protein [Streptomyces sp. MI02-7b]